MKNKYFSAISAVLYIVCILSCIFFISTDFFDNVVSHISKIISAALIILSGLAGTYLNCISVDSKSQKRKKMHLSLKIFFSIYLVIIINFTLIDGSFGRDIANAFTWNDYEFKQYIINNTNITPFATISLFYKGYTNGYLTLFTFLENILGNFCVFIPFALLIPVTFEKVNKWYKILTVLLLMVIIIEILQLFLLTGSSDIDDLILNVSGAMIIYGVLRIKFISKALEKLTFGVWKNSKK